MGAQEDKKKVVNALGEEAVNLMAVFSTTAGAAEIYLRMAERCIEGRGYKFKYNKKLVYNELLASVRRTRYLFDALTENCITFSDDESIEAFDTLLSDSNAIARLIMRYYNAVYSQDHREEIDEYLKRLEGQPIFSEQMVETNKLH